MIIPSRGRPNSVPMQADAWRSTGGDQHAELFWAIDADDPFYDQYVGWAEQHDWMRIATLPTWQPMVHKLNQVAGGVAQAYDVVGFMGDDHFPRTSGWVSALAAAHILNGPGIFYGRDGYQDIKLPTWWAMSSKIIRALGAMVPADVEHMYCDNVVLEMGKAARVLRYLPSVYIEHVHPVAGKAEWDEGYRRVNAPQQYERDKARYLAWLETGRADCATILRELARGV